MVAGPLEHENQSDEISLYEIVDFFVSNLTTIVFFIILSAVIGLVISIALPVKYEASAQIQTTHVAILNVDPISRILDIKSSPVEAKEVLAEKLKSPTYFDQSTIQACELNKSDNPELTLSKSLNSSITRNSNFVSIRFQAASPSSAKACLESVLRNVVANQSKIAAPLIDNIQVALKTLNEQLQAAQTVQQQLLKQNIEKLNIARAKLESDQKFVDQFSKEALSFKFDDPQFSASALLLSTLITKQNDIKELEIEINKMQMEVDSKTTSKDNEVLELLKQVNDVKNALTAPQTKPASFATPIYAPNERVEPKRSIIVVVSVLVGFMLSIVFLLGRRAWRHLEAQRAAKRHHGVTPL